MEPHSDYKDSGIDWIGKIPRHWRIVKLNHVSKNHDQKRIPLSAEERGKIQGNIAYYGANGIIDYIDKHIFDGKYLLVGEDGAPFFSLNRDVAFIAKGKFWVNNHAHILSIHEGYNMNYICYCLNMVNYKNHIGGSTRDKLTQSALSAIKIPLPSLKEQQAIANYLDRETSQIDTLIEKTEQSIEYLKEYRTALISSAVTGKIDVRGTVSD